MSLFLEMGYNPDAMYTLKDYDHTYKGRLIPSIKKLYLELADPTEYVFANKYLAGWKHWMKINENNMFTKHIQEWRDELEYKLRAASVAEMVKLSKEGNYQASKWLADRGWQTRQAGRPSKAEVDKQKKLDARIDDEYSADIVRLKVV